MRALPAILVLLPLLVVPVAAESDARPPDALSRVPDSILESGGDPAPWVPVVLDLPGVLDDGPATRRVVRIVARAGDEAAAALFARVDGTPEGSPVRRALAAESPALAARFAEWREEKRRSESTVALRFSGRIDGSERIEISMDDARWRNVHWGVSRTTVALGGIEWTPRENPVLSNAGPHRFLPEAVDFRSARLVRFRGRDTVALEAHDESVTVLVADDPNGTDLYEFEIRFRPLGRPAELRIAARIEGSDELVITPDGARWRQINWGWPHSVNLGGIAWTPRECGHLANAGDTRFLPEGVVLSTARLVSRKGRDLLSLEVNPDRLVVHFADTPCGPGDYEAVIRFGP